MPLHKVVIVYKSIATGLSTFRNVILVRNLNLFNIEITDHRHIQVQNVQVAKPIDGIGWC